MKEGRKPEYPEKTPGDELQVTTPKHNKDLLSFEADTKHGSLENDTEACHTGDWRSTTD